MQIFSKAKREERRKKLRVGGLFFAVPGRRVPRADAQLLSLDWQSTDPPLWQQRHMLGYPFNPSFSPARLPALRCAMPA